MELDYRPENASTNFSLITTQVSKLHDGKISKLGNVKMVVGDLDDPKKKDKIKKALKKLFPNIDIEEKDDRLVIKTSYKTKQLLKHMKQKRPAGLLQDLRWSNPLLNPVPKPVQKNVLLAEALMDKALKKSKSSPKSSVDWNSIQKAMKGIDHKLQMAQADKKLLGVAQMMQEAQAATGALQWAKQLQEEQRVANIKRKFGPVVKQLLEKPVKLKTVDKGAQQWQKELQQQARVAVVRNLMKPIHQQIKKIPARKPLDSQNLKRIQKIRQGLKNALGQIKKGHGVHRLKAVDAGAVQWMQQLQGSSTGKDQPCQAWKKDKSHNPFNKTKKGPKLVQGGAVFNEIVNRCQNREIFCQHVAHNKKKVEKYCSK